MTQPWIESRSPDSLANTLTIMPIYIYIYTYIDPRADFFVVKQIFSVARHVGRLKLGSKPAQLYVRLSIIPLSQQANHVSSGTLRYYVMSFVCLHFIHNRISEYSIRSKGSALCDLQLWIPPPECSIRMGESISVGRQWLWIILV